MIWPGSCRNEIFGGGRRDMYEFSNKTSPVFKLTTFGIQWAGSVPWRIIAFDRVWKNVNAFGIARSTSTQNTASWCFFQTLCKYCARRGMLKSIFAGSWWPLSLGSMGKKNTVCLLLECWPLNINPLLTIKWRLNAHSVVNMLEESTLNYHNVL